MRHRLPIVLSVTALFVAVLGFTSVGEAAKHLVLGRDSVGSKQLKNNAVGTSHLKSSSVGSGKIKNNSILSIDIRDDQVRTDDVRGSAITTAKLAEKSVTTAKLADKSVTTSKLASGPAARVASTATTAVPTGAAFVALPFNLETFDVSGMHNPTTNTSRLTIATAGLYMVGASVMWAASPKHPEVSLRVTSGATVRMAARVSQAGEAVVADQSVSTLVYLKAGDYVEVVVRQTGAASVNVLAQTALDKPAFWATWVGNPPA